jgi:hypothetical protein
MQKSALLDAIRQEIHRHDLSHFMDEENKRVVPGCPKCQKRFFTVPQFIDHLSDDVLPPLLDRLSSNEKDKLLSPATAVQTDPRE